MLGSCESESGSVMSDSLRSHGLYSPWNSPGQNTGVGSYSLLQGIFPTQGSNPHLLHCRQILYQLSYKGVFPYRGNTKPDIEVPTHTKGKVGCFILVLTSVYCHPAYLTYRQSTSCEMLGWMRHKLESRFLGEISVSSDILMTPLLWQKVKRN